MTIEDEKEIKRRIQSLPKGAIIIKHISGREYEYWQFRENGKQITKRIKGEDLEILRTQIDERKRLEKRLKHKSVSRDAQTPIYEHTGYHYEGMMRIGEELLRFAEPVRSYKKREIFRMLYSYVYGPDNDRVFVLYGLRRTGKTTMIRQMVLEMNSEMQKKTASLQVHPNETLSSLNQDLKNWNIRDIVISLLTKLHCSLIL